MEDGMEGLQDENVDPQAEEVRRSTGRKPMPLSEKLGEVEKFASSVPPCIKGQEGQYLHSLLLKYQTWFQQSLNAPGTFDEVAASIERMGKRRDVHVSHLISYFQI